MVVLLIIQKDLLQSKKYVEADKKLKMWAKDNLELDHEPLWIGAAGYGDGFRVDIN